MWYKLAQNSENLNIPIPDILRQILLEINNNGGVGYLIGGIVRDALFNKIHGTNIPSKDYDVEVFRLPYEKLIEILSKFGSVDDVGKQFSVIKLNAGGEDYDFSLPRKDSKMQGGVGHKDFNVVADENLTEEEAGARRDVTINSLLFNPINNTLVDSYGGIKDINSKTLRHINEQFSEDPLRVLRLMSLSSRFGLELSPETAELAKTIKHEYQYLPKERVEQEFKKLVQKGVEPGRVLDILGQTEWDDNFQVIKDLHSTPQDHIFHPEGGVGVHTKLVMNAAAEIANRENLTPEEREVLIYSALAHDFAKPKTTATMMKKGRPTITSHGHEEQGGPMAREFLQNIGVNKRIIDQVVPLVENHLNHIHHSNSKNQEAFVKQLAERLHPATVKQLIHLIEADHSGRHPLPPGLPTQAQLMAEQAKQHNAYESKVPDLLQGRDVMEYLGGKGGPNVGQILKEHRNMLLNHHPEMSDRQSALKWLHNRMQRESGLINGNDVINTTGAKGPEIKNILDRAWQAQRQGVFSDKAGALAWLGGQNK